MVNKILIISIILITCQPAFTQEITFIAWNDTVYAPLDTFPANAVADDFGPRRCCSPTNRNWHGGVDYNSFQNTGNNGNDDLWDMILVPEDGTIVDVNRLWTTQWSYKQLCYQVDNTHRYIFGHVYDNTGASYIENDSTVILKQMIPRPTNPNEVKWAQIIFITTDTLINNTLIETIDTFTYGQVLGNVEWNGDTLTTTTTVNAGDPLVPLGESAANGAAHLHLNTIPLNKDHSTGATTYNSNPLQYIDYDKADYDINLYSQGDTNGIHIVYPGTDITPIATKVKMQTTVSGIGNKRYDHIFDVNRVRLLVSNGTFTDSLLRGPAKQSITNLGGKLNENKVNHANPLFGSWTRTGVFSAAYNAGYPNMPYDIYHYSDFVHRIHKDDPMDGGQAQIADCPDESRYIDGHYKIYTEVTDIRDSTFYSDTLSFTLDNWKPYIKDVFIFIGDSLIYNEDWTCNNDCVQFSNNNLNPTLSGADLENDMSITITVSEPLDSLSLSIPSLGVSNQVLVPSDDSLIWDTTIDAYILSNLQPTEISFEFSGSDNNNNQLISFPSSAPGDCFAIPTRDTNTTFDDPNTINLTFGIDSIHGFQINCAAIDTLKGGQNSNSRNSGYQTIISIDAPAITAEETIDDSYCYPECNNGSISIQVDNADAYNIEWSTGDTTFDLADLDAGSYTYTITDNLCGYLEGTVAIECNPIEIQFQTTPSCDNDGTIEAIVFGGEAPYTFVWQDDANETTNIRTGLGSNLYTIIVTDSNDCTNEASVFIKNVDPIDIENMEYYITNAHCDVPGSISIYPPSGGSAPFTYACSNGVSGSLDDEDGDVIYNLTAGNYTVTLTDVEGCSATLQFEIGLDGLPDIAVITVEHTCAGEEDGLVALDFTDYTINWSTGATGNIISDLAQGVYYYTVTDTDNGCSTQESIEIEALDADSDPIMASIVSVSNCIGGDSDNGKIFLTVSGGIPPYSYYWSNGSTTKNIKKLGQGDYYVTITDQCGLTGVFGEYVDDVEISANMSWQLAFGSITVQTDAMGGVEPYTYNWNTGESDSEIVTSDEGTYKVTISDSEGCTVEDAVTISLDCTPLALQLDAFPPLSADCESPTTIRFDPSDGNSSIIGNPPFQVNISFLENGQYVEVDNKTLLSISALSIYYYSSSSTGVYKVSVLDNCGKKFEEVFRGCYTCDYEFYNGGGDNSKVFVDIFDGMLTFEQVCPCTDDCDLFGFTHNKIKLYLDEQAILASNFPQGFFNITVIWPKGPNTVITKNNVYDPYGPSEYVLTTDEFNGGLVTVTVQYNLLQNGTLNVQCEADIPFEFGKQGFNGEFICSAKNFDIFEPAFEKPYYIGTGVCSTECVTPLISGVLYANQPEGFAGSSVIKCDDENPSGVYYRFHPTDWNNPCSGGGFLETHVESNGSIIVTNKYIEPNLALDEAIAYISYLPLDYLNLFCTDEAEYRGYCLFEGLDVYGVEIRNHLVATYCSEAVWLEDSDGDYIPDISDPCPQIWGTECDDPSTGGPSDDDDPNTGGPNVNGCSTTFTDGEECSLEIDCVGEETVVIEGSTVTEVYSGSEPCLHCFSVDLCTVTDPETSEEYIEIISFNSGMTITIGDINECGNVCAIVFTCNLTGEVFWLCASDCQTSTNPLCNHQQVVDIVSLLNNNDDTEKFEVEVTEETVLNILNLKRENNISSTSTLEVSTIPNPSFNDHRFIIHANSLRSFKSTLSIYNIFGELIIQNNIKVRKGVNEYQIDKTLPPGVYFIKILDNQKIITTKHAVQD